MTRDFWSRSIALRFLLATDPDALTMVRGAVYRTLSGYLLKTAGLTRATGDTGAVTLIQRFGSARHLERRGLLVRDVENSYLDSPPGADSALPGRAAPQWVCSARKWWDGGDSGPGRRRLELAVRGSRRFGDTARSGRAIRQRFEWHNLLTHAGIV